MICTEITSGPIDLAQLYTWAKTPQAGAVVAFSGTTRDSFEGKRVVALRYDAHVELASRTLERIAKKAESDPDVLNVAIVHRIGLVPTTEESVYIVVSSGHRRAAWETASAILEQVKQSVEIWKREEYDDGSSSWVPGVPRQEP